MAWSGSAWLMLSFSPFPMRHPAQSIWLNFVTARGCVQLQDFRSEARGYGMVWFSSPLPRSPLPPSVMSPVGMMHFSPLVVVAALTSSSSADSDGSECRAQTKISLLGSETASCKLRSKTEWKKFTAWYFEIWDRTQNHATYRTRPVKPTVLLTLFLHP